MSLTGGVLLAVVVVLTLACFVGVVLGIPRIAGRRPTALLARTGALLVVNLMVLLTATVVLNDQFTFFADWTDLRGALFGGQQAAMASAGGSASQAANAPVPGPSATGSASDLPALPSLPPAAGTADRVLRYMVTGARSGLRGVVLVTLPQGYADPANSTRRYPVLETFHGYPGDPGAWVDALSLGSYLDAGVRRKTVGEMITVSPTLLFPPGVDTECVDGTGSAPMVETWLAQDVPNWIASTLRVRTDRSSWATMGFSMGAWCAAMATMLHPQQYAAGIVMGGYFSPSFLKSYVPFAPGSPQAQRYDLVALAHRAPPSVALWVETSHSDPISYPSTSRLLAAAHPPLSVQALVLSHAGHRVSLWEGEIPQVLAWLGKNVSGFAPHSGP